MSAPQAAEADSTTSKAGRSSWAPNWPSIRLRATAQGYRLHVISPSTRFIMLQVHEDRGNVLQAICSGASGYLLKSTAPEEIVESLRQVRQGAAPINPYIAAELLQLFDHLRPPQENYGLTPREKEILELMVEGLIMKQIADRLNLSYHTIDTHIRNIYSKLHVHSRGGAVSEALKERLV